MTQNNDALENTEPLDDEQISDDDLVEDIAEAEGDGGSGDEGDLSAAIKAAGLDEEPLDDEQDDDEEVAEDEFVEDETFGDDSELTMESVIEAVLFACDEPLSVQRLVNILETGSVKQVRACVKSLNEKYDSGEFAFRIEQIAGGYQMMTLNPYNHWLTKLLRVRGDTKLSQAALETLAILAYKQPIIRADVEAIRGVAAGEMIRSLMYKGLVKIVGRAEVLGRPLLYGTTKKFLDIFALNTLKDLPKIEELKRPQQ